MPQDLKNSHVTSNPLRGFIFWFLKLIFYNQEFKTDITKVMVILEEQNHNWKMALDGYDPLHHRQDDHERRITKLESDI